MTRDPEAVRRRALDVLQSSGEALAKSYSRQVPTADEMWQLPEPEPQPSPQPAPAMVPAAVREWVQRHVQDCARAMGEELVKILDREESAMRQVITEAERRVMEHVEASESATVDLLLQIERRLDALEQRSVQPARPRLVAGGSDAG